MPAMPADAPGCGVSCPEMIMSVARAFMAFAGKVSKWAGHPVAFTLGSVTVLAWAVSWPYFRFSETWQLVINTGTTIVTFLMVFLIQNDHNISEPMVRLREYVQRGV